MKYMIIQNSDLLLPFKMFEGHEEQAMKNHGQTLERLRERGGLDLYEALAILEDRDWKKIDKNTAVKMLKIYIQNNSKANK